MKEGRLPGFGNEKGGRSPKFQNLSRYHMYTDPYGKLSENLSTTRTVDLASSNAVKENIFRTPNLPLLPN